MTLLMQYNTLQICWVQNQEHQEDQRDQNARPEEHPYTHR